MVRMREATRPLVSRDFLFPSWDTSAAERPMLSLVSSQNTELRLSSLSIVNHTHPLETRFDVSARLLRSVQ